MKNTELAQIVARELNEKYNLNIDVIDDRGYRNLHVIFLVAAANTDPEYFQIDILKDIILESGKAVHYLSKLDAHFNELRRTKSDKKELRLLEKFSTLFKMGLSIVASYNDLDIEKYMSREFTFMQTFQISLNIMNGANPELYAKPEYSHVRMRVLELATRNGLNVEDYKDLHLADYELYKKYFKALEEAEKVC